MSLFQRILSWAYYRWAYEADMAEEQAEWDSMVADQRVQVALRQRDFANDIGYRTDH